MVLVTGSPWISPMAHTQNVYVYRERDGGVRAREPRKRGGATMRYVWGDNMRGEIG